MSVLHLIKFLHAKVMPSLSVILHRSALHLEQCYQQLYKGIKVYTFTWCLYFHVSKQSALEALSLTYLLTRTCQFACRYMACLQSNSRQYELPQGWDIKSIVVWGCIQLLKNKLECKSILLMRVVLAKFIFRVMAKLTTSLEVAICVSSSLNILYTTCNYANLHPFWCSTYLELFVRQGFT